MLGAFSTDTYLPSFPSIAAEFRIGLDVVQQTLTVYLLAMAVMTLFHGTLSDAMGRRPIILGGLALYIAASFGAFFAHSFSFLLICRVTQGMFAGVGMVVGRAMIRDRFSGPEAQTVMSYTTVVFGLAPVVAPILGGWLEVAFGWRSVFGFLAIFGFLLLAACTLKLSGKFAGGEAVASAPADDFEELPHHGNRPPIFASVPGHRSGCFRALHLHQRCPCLRFTDSWPLRDILRVAICSDDYRDHGRIVGCWPGGAFLASGTHHRRRIWPDARRCHRERGLRCVSHRRDTLGGYSDHAVHLRHGVCLSGYDHRNAGSLSRTTRHGRLAPVGVRHGRFLNLLWSRGPFPLWKCSQAGLWRSRGLSGQRGALGLWAAAAPPARIGNSRLMREILAI